ncbi:MAG: GIY-YIG nuclease family protein [Candidatus Omnitrophica bacterium]|nr:GIY-YIG nuclease family protein [Candidatus Omnitrophota bacterium]MDD5356028.1 GIY-YIG nuclease family protein [Candidatus Omnitrophota bacterium]
MYYVYILKNTRTNELYYGYTNNIERRIAEHSRKQPQELVYYEAYKSESDARNREMKLKHHAQALTALKGRLSESLK